MKRIDIIVPIWEEEINVVIGQTEEDMEEFLSLCNNLDEKSEKIVAGELDPDLPYHFGHNGASVIWVPESYTREECIATAAAQFSYAVFELLRYRGVERVEDSPVQFAYTLNYLNYNFLHNLTEE